MQSRLHTRGLTALLALLLALCAALPALAADDGIYGIIVGEGLNLRSAASMNGSLLGAYGKGERVKIITEQDGWYRVIAPDGVTGYMSAQYIELENGSDAFTPAPEGTATTALVFGEPQGLPEAIEGPQPVLFEFGKAVPSVTQPPAQEVLSIGTVQQTGKGNVRELDEGGVKLSVSYPVLDSTQANAALRRWIDNTLTTAQARAAQGHTVEVSAAYDSYFVQGRYISVLIVGTMATSEPEHATVAYALNLDTWTGDLLQYQHIYGTDNAYTILAMVHDALAQQGEEPVRSLAPDALQYSVLTNDGVYVLVPDVGDMPARSLVLPYALLVEQGLLGGDMDLDIPAEQDPDATAEPGAAVPVAEGEEGEAATSVPEEKTRKMVALTFDDGPAESTPKILDILAANNAKATFFIVGNRARTYPDILKRTADEGHEIGTHTWSHEKLTDLGRSGVSNQIDDSLAAISARTDTPVRWLRPPYGSYNSDVRSVCRHRDLGIALWDIDTEDWKTKDADETYRVIMNNVRNGTVILCHDLQESTAVAMERVIPDLIAKGYELVTMSELVEYAYGEMEVGRVYTKVELPDIPDAPLPTASPEPLPTTEGGDTLMPLGTSAPEETDAAVFYNPRGGQYYHSDSRCWTVDPAFLPLTQMREAEARASSLKPCPTCVGE